MSSRASGRPATNTLFDAAGGGAVVLPGVRVLATPFQELVGELLVTLPAVLQGEQSDSQLGLELAVGQSLDSLCSLTQRPARPKVVRGHRRGHLPRLNRCCGHYSTRLRGQAPSRAPRPAVEWARRAGGSGSSARAGCFDLRKLNAEGVGSASLRLRGAHSITARSRAGRWRRRLLSAGPLPRLGSRRGDAGRRGASGRVIGSSPVVRSAERAAGAALSSSGTEDGVRCRQLCTTLIVDAPAACCCSRPSRRPDSGSFAGSAASTRSGRSMSTMKCASASSEWFAKSPPVDPITTRRLLRPRSLRHQR